MKRGFVTIDIEADAAFCVAARRMSEFDRPVVEDPRDLTAYVPMTGLIGSLRAHATRRNEDTANQLFGTLESDDAVVVRGLGTRTHLGENAIARSQLQRREQTAIDRERGAARSMSLRKSQAVPPGAVIRMYIEIISVASLDNFVELAQSWTPSIGSSRTAGLGRAHVKRIAYGILDTSISDDREKFVSHTGPELVEKVATTEATIEVQATTAVWQCDFQVKGPVLVRGATTGNTTAALQRSNQFHIDGTTWKGLFRSTAEFIVQSLCAATKTPYSSDAIDWLFGTSDRKGVLEFSETAIANAQAKEHPRVHNSIDRITGGASDKRLFCDLPAESGTLTLSVHATNQVPTWARQLLDLVARDIHDGYVGLGSATSRGYGSLQRTSPDSEFHASTKWLEQVLTLEGA